MIFATIAPKMDTVQPAIDELKRYIQLALPSHLPEGNIDKVEEMDKESLKTIRDRLIKKPSKE